MSVNTAFLLMAQYEGRAIIPLETVRQDYFAHLSIDKLTRKMVEGEIAIPLVRFETSQKSGKGVHLQDLADYLDTRRLAAKKELAQMIGH